MTVLAATRRGRRRFLRRDHVVDPEDHTRDLGRGIDFLDLDPERLDDVRFEHVQRLAPEHAAAHRLGAFLSMLGAKLAEHNYRVETQIWPSGAMGGLEPPRLRICR